MYVRMTFRAVEVYDLLEPLLKDFGKLRMRSMGTPLLYLKEPNMDNLYSGLYTDVHGRVRG
jgi:pre-mRNA-splicing factor 38A